MLSAQPMRMNRDAVVPLLIMGPLETIQQSIRELFNGPLMDATMPVFGTMRSWATTTAVWWYTFRKECFEPDPSRCVPTRDCTLPEEAPSTDRTIPVTIRWFQIQMVASNLRFEHCCMDPTWKTFPSREKTKVTHPGPLQASRPLTKMRYQATEPKHRSRSLMVLGGNGGARHGT